MRLILELFRIVGKLTRSKEPPSVRLGQFQGSSHSHKPRQLTARCHVIHPEACAARNDLPSTDNELSIPIGSAGLLLDVPHVLRVAGQGLESLAGNVCGV